MPYMANSCLDNGVGNSMHWADTHSIEHISCSKKFSCMLWDFTNQRLQHSTGILFQCSPVWSPQTNVLKNKIEKIQRCFTKRFLVSGILLITIIVGLQLHSLEYMRVFFGFVYCYKITNGLIDTEIANC